MNSRKKDPHEWGVPVATSISQNDDNLPPSIQSDSITPSDETTGGVPTEPTVIHALHQNHWLNKKTVDDWDESVWLKNYESALAQAEVWVPAHYIKQRKNLCLRLSNLAEMLTGMRAVHTCLH